MSQRIPQIKTLKVIKAFRGQSLTIDLGTTFTGTLSAWMKKKATDTTYRSFTIVDNRYLFLPKEKAQDIGSELVEGKWYFDVRELPLGETDPNLEQIQYKGTIDFSNHITDSDGTETATVAEAQSGMIALSNTASVYGTPGQIVKAKNLIIKIPELKVVKAIRGQALTIDLGKTYDGALEAWMKTDPNDETYRSFTIVDGRYLYLPKDKTQDYYDIESGDLIQAIEGKWYYDVRLLPTGATNSNDEQTIYKGVIHFKNQVTGSAGQELVYTNRPYAGEFILLNDTPLSYVGSEGKTLKVNDTATGVEFQDIIEDLHYTHDQGMPSAVWTVAHNLNKYPSAAAVDTAGSVVVGLIEYIDINNITITFNAAFSGYAYIN